MAAAPPVPVRAIVRRFWPYARPYRLTLLVVLALAALAPVIDAATVWIFKVVVDDVLVPRDAGLFVWVAARLPRPGAAGRGGLVRRRLPADVGERALPAAPAHGRLPPPAPPVAELPRPAAPGRHDVARHERRRGDRGLRALGRRRRPLGGRAAARLRRRPLPAVLAARRGRADRGAAVLAGLALLLAPDARGLARAPARERLAGRAGRGEPVQRLAGAGLPGRRPRGRALRPPGPPGHARRADGDAHPRPLRPGRRPDRGRRRADRDRPRHLRDEPGPPEPRRPAGVHGLPQPHVLAAARAGEPGELALLGRRRRGAGDRAARRAAGGGRAPRRPAARAPARRGGGRGRLVHLPRRARPRPARREHARRPGRARGGRRRERLGQVDARAAAAAPRRSRRRRRAAGRPRPARPGAGLRCAATSPCCCRRR